MFHNEAFGIIYDSDEEKRQATEKAVKHWRCSQTTTHAISGLLSFTSYVVQMEGEEEEELFQRFSGNLECRLLRECWSVIIGSVSLKTVDARIKFAQINGRIVMFCSATQSTQGAYVLDHWLREHCNPMMSNGDRAMCKSSDFERCLDFFNGL